MLQTSSFMLQIHLQNILSDLWMRVSQIASHHPVVQMGVTVFNAGVNLLNGLASHPGSIELFLVASCYRN